MLRRCEPRHILHQSEYRHIDLVVHIHVDAFACIRQRHLLRSGDDNRPRDVDGLNEREVDIAGSRRCVDHEVVEFPPECVGDELLDGVRSHSSPPEGGLVGVDEESDRQHLDPVFLNRHDHVASVHILCIRPSVLSLKHLRHRGSEDISIKESDAVAHLGKPDGEVDRHGALPHSSFSA